MTVAEGSFAARSEGPVAEGRAELAGELMAAHIRMAHESFVRRRFAEQG